MMQALVIVCLAIILLGAPILIVLAKVGFAGYFLYGFICVTAHYILERA